MTPGQGGGGEVGGGEAPWAVVVPVGYRIGPWRVTHGIASGSWGSVYAASREPDVAPHPQGLPEQAALKFLPTGTVTPRHLAHLADMTRRELDRHSRLRHPRLVRTHQVLTVDDPDQPELDGATVLVMELAVGSLADPLVGGPADGPRRLLEVAEALAYVHGSRWVHGDLKPSNVLVMADGRCCLTDFGVAGELDGTHAYLPPAGAPEYSPPERWLAPNTARGQEVRPSCDVWAFGVLAHRVLTGRSPFPGPTSSARVDAAGRHVSGQAALDLSGELDPGWRCLVEDCLEPGEGNRPTAAMVVRRVRGLVGTTGSVPSGADPVGTEPVGTDPVGTDPVGTDPVGTEPVGTEPRILTGTEPGSRTGAGSRTRASARSRVRPSPQVAAALAGLGAVAVLATGSALGWWTGPAVTPSTVRVPTSPDTGHPPGRCLPRAETHQDPAGRSWDRVWVCTNDTAAPMFAGPTERTLVGWLDTTTSWFLCHRSGEEVDGVDVWYYTQGDRAAVGHEDRRAWGFLPGSRIDVPTHPAPGIPECPSDGTGTTGTG